MKKLALFSFFIFLSIFSQKNMAQTTAFSISSKDLGKYFSLKQVYDKYNCGGMNISPQLYWENPPEKTKSFAITMFDPDAPTGKGWWHWLIFNISPQIKELPSGAGSINANSLPPEIIQSINDYNEYGYGGPCPPPGKAHRYFITIYALNVPALNIPPETPPELAYKKIRAHTIEKAKIISLYGR